VHQTDNHNSTPLFLAAQGGRWRMCTRLVALGADLNHSDDLGRTALFRAVEQDEVATAAVLLEMGALSTTVDKTRHTVRLLRPPPADWLAGWLASPARCRLFSVHPLLTPLPPPPLPPPPALITPAPTADTAN
jgi:ankyrin repeat protein